MQNAVRLLRPKLEREWKLEIAETPKHSSQSNKLVRLLGMDRLVSVIPLRNATNVDVAIVIPPMNQVHGLDTRKHQLLVIGDASMIKDERLIVAMQQLLGRLLQGHTRLDGAQGYTRVGFISIPTQKEHRSWFDNLSLNELTAVLAVSEYDGVEMFSAAGVRELEVVGQRNYEDVDRYDSMEITTGRRVRWLPKENGPYKSLASKVSGVAAANEDANSSSGSDIDSRYSGFDEAMDGQQL